MAKPDSARRSNDQIANRAVRLHFVSRVPMLCECGDPACQAVVLITLDDYRNLRRDPSAFLTAPGHKLARGRPQRQETDYWLQRRSS